MLIFKCLHLRLHFTDCVTDRKRSVRKPSEIAFKCSFLSLSKILKQQVSSPSRVSVDSLMAIMATQIYEQRFAEKTLQLLHIDMEVDNNNNNEAECLSKTCNDFFFPLLLSFLCRNKHAVQRMKSLSVFSYSNFQNIIDSKETNNPEVYIIQLLST